MLRTDANGNVSKEQFSHDEIITSAKLPFQVNSGKNPFTIKCLVGGDVTFLTWGGETVTRTLVAGDTYEVLAKTVTAIPDDTSFSAFY
jgi:hypothetical protein